MLVGVGVAEGGSSVGLGVQVGGSRVGVKVAVGGWLVADAVAEAGWVKVAVGGGLKGVRDTVGVEVADAVTVAVGVTVQVTVSRFGVAEGPAVVTRIKTVGDCVKVGVERVAVGVAVGLEPGCGNINNNQPKQ